MTLRATIQVYGWRCSSKRDTNTEILSLRCAQAQNDGGRDVDVRAKARTYLRSKSKYRGPSLRAFALRSGLTAKGKRRFPSGMTKSDWPENDKSLSARNGKQKRQPTLRYSPQRAKTARRGSRDAKDGPPGICPTPTGAIITNLAANSRKRMA